MSEINHCQITARIVKIGTPRYTPAGIYCCRLWVEHRSRQTENGRPVAIKARLQVQLVGDRWKQVVSVLQLDAAVKVEGFLSATDYRDSTQEQLQLQATRIERL